MNAQDQIKERAKEVSNEYFTAINHGATPNLAKIVELALTAQQTADAAAYRELKREHNETLDVLLSLRNSCDDALYQRDTARAESAKLREVLGRIASAIRNMAEMPEYDQDDVWRLRDKAKKALALAATVLKEGE